MKTHTLIVFLMIFTMIAAACRDNGEDTEGALPGEGETAKLESPNPTPGPEMKKYDFRGSDWGATREEVMATERDKPVSEAEDTLDYKTVIDGMPMMVNYKFRDNKLVRGGFLMNEVIKDNNEYLKRYEKLKELLINVNGSPRIDIEKQLKPDAVIDEEHIGDAVCSGDILYGAQWTLPDTIVNLVLNGQESKCYLTIIYTSSEEIRFLMNKNGAEEEN